MFILLADSEMCDWKALCEQNLRSGFLKNDFSFLMSHCILLFNKNLFPILS